MSKVQACATCLKTELEVEMKHCAKCKIITYCSKDCGKKNWENHKGHCRDIRQGGSNMIEAILEIAFLHNNAMALQKGAKMLQDPMSFRDATDLICFYIELGKNNAWHTFSREFLAYLLRGKLFEMRQQDETILVPSLVQDHGKMARDTRPCLHHRSLVSVGHSNRGLPRDLAVRKIRKRHIDPSM